MQIQNTFTFLFIANFNYKYCKSDFPIDKTMSKYYHAKIPASVAEWLACVVLILC